MNRSKITFNHTNLCFMLATEHLWWLLRSASPMDAHCRHVCQSFALSFHYTPPLHIKHFHSDQLVAFSA